MLISKQSTAYSDSTRVAEIKVLREISDTTTDGRVFYVSQMFFEGKEGFFGNNISMNIIREINEKRITAENENRVIKEDIADCNKELMLADKTIRLKDENFLSMQSKYDNEVYKNENNTIVLKDYKKKVMSGKIMTVVGGVGIGVGIAGILYGVIVTQTK